MVIEHTISISGGDVMDSQTELLCSDCPKIVNH